MEHLFFKVTILLLAAIVWVMSFFVKIVSIYLAEKIKSQKVEHLGNVLFAFLFCLGGAVLVCVLFSILWEVCFL